MTTRTPSIAPRFRPLGCVSVGWLSVGWTVLVWAVAVLPLAGCVDVNEPGLAVSSDSCTASVTTNLASYGETDSVVVGWTCLTGSATDWIAIGRSGSDPKFNVTWVYTGGAVDGSHSFAASLLGAGTFVARAFANGTETLLDQSDPFVVVAPAASITSDQSTYVFGTSVTVSWSHLAAFQYSWVEIGPEVPAGAGDLYEWVFTGGTTSGSHTFDVILPHGRFIARAFEESGDFIAASAVFEVTGPGGPAIDAPELVTPSTGFSVSYSGLAGIGGTDWLAIAPWGAPPTSGYVQSRSAPNHSGTASFDGLPTGRYEARAYDWAGGPLRDPVAVDEFSVTSASCAALPDATACESTGQCFQGICISPSGVCGDGVRDWEGAAREGCDDGYTTPVADACDSTCHPTALVIASREGLDDLPAAGAPSVAEDGSGELLFVWLAQRIVDGETTRDLVARRYSSAGVPRDEAPLVLELDVGVSQPIRPSVAGLASGWAVTWRSRRVETGALASEGGIALRIVPRAGDTLGAVRQVNTTVLLDQLDPRVAVLSTGLVVVWTDLSTEVSTGDLRMRFLSASGAPSSAELRVATDDVGDQSSPFIVARGDAASLQEDWAVAWTTAPTDVEALPEVRMRRFQDRTALDASDIPLSHFWGSGVTLSAASTGIWAAWTSRAVDTRGDIAVRFVGDGSVAPDPSDLLVSHHTAGGTGAHAIDELPAIAAFPRQAASGYVVAYETSASVGGGRLATSTGLTLPAEATSLAALLESGQGSFSMLPTRRGLWLTWADPSLTFATNAFVAYLMPWDDAAAYDDCTPNPCLHGGLCNDGNASFTCTCAPGYSGPICATFVEMCGPGVDCNDGLACTADGCASATGCYHAPLDSDSDGDSDCIDCAPSDPDRHSGATEVCNALDDDCDGVTDEGVSLSVFADCDGDTWAPVEAISFDGCILPPTSDTGCGTPNAAWTTRPPGYFEDFDCADDDTRAHVGATDFEKNPILSAFPEVDFDFNCDWVEEPLYPTTGKCITGATCELATGWFDTVAECGDSADYVVGCDAGCGEIVVLRTQACR